MTAAAGPRVKVVGDDAALRDLQRWADQLGPEVAKGSRDLGDRLAGRVRERVPRLTGRLASSVDSEPTEEGFDLSMGGGVVYAGWIEFGGSRGREYISEGRYLYPTAVAATGEWGDTAEDIATDTIRRFPWSQAT